MEPLAHPPGTRHGVTWTRARPLEVDTRLPETSSYRLRLRTHSGGQPATQVRTRNRPLRARARPLMLRARPLRTRARRLRTCACPLTTRNRLLTTRTCLLRGRDCHI
jgi:hypothetical protein